MMDCCSITDVVAQQVVAAPLPPQWARLPAPRWRAELVELRLGNSLGHH